jgi:hypothetical protein
VDYTKVNISGLHRPAIDTAREQWQVMLQARQHGIWTQQLDARCCKLQR